MSDWHEFRRNYERSDTAARRIEVTFLTIHLSSVIALLCLVFLL